MNVFLIKSYFFNRYDLCSLLRVIKRYKEAEEMINSALDNGRGCKFLFIFLNTYLVLHIFFKYFVRILILFSLF